MKRIDIFDVAYLLIGLPWLFLMLFTSRMYSEVKIGMLIFLFMISSVEIVTKNIKIEGKDLRFVLLFIGYCTLSLFIGILSGFDFDIKTDFSLLQYYFITPLCVFIMSKAIRCKRTRKDILWNFLIYFTLALAFLDVAKVALFIIGIDSPLLSFIKMASSEMEETKFALRVTNELSLMFLLPIFVYLLVNPDKKDFRSRIIYFLIVFFGILYGMLSGRKMLELEILLSFLFSIVYVHGRLSIRNVFEKVKPKYIFIIVFFCIIAIFLFQNFSSYIGIDNLPSLAYETIANGLSSDSEGVSKRAGNATALYDMWYSSPLWGNGLNSYAENSLANDETKWSYEIFYTAWLAQTGLIGIILLSVIVIVLIKRLNKAGRLLTDNRYYALVLGLVCFVIASSSNPLIYLIWPWTIVYIYSPSNLVRTSLRKT